MSLGIVIFFNNRFILGFRNLYCQQIIQCQKCGYQCLGLADTISASIGQRSSHSQLGCPIELFMSRYFRVTDTILTSIGQRSSPSQLCCPIGLFMSKHFRAALYGGLAERDSNTWRCVDTGYLLHQENNSVVNRKVIVALT
ncbi:hypothetical protein CDAR_124371 [Caerostris darwini]|uniref:Uncharacterized protein n=1 Tax=Caerostris darwini TaxID=1538125 RepID=A0AAV4RJ94_9ARAC|nr:hypothetical protein CDAR_124371 [Caerostris darwini]